MLRTIAPLALLLLGGCANILTPGNTTTTVWVTASCGQAQNIGARCTMAVQGSRASFDTPAQVVLANSFSPVTLVCEGEMIGTVTEVMMPKPNMGMVGNLLLGGAPGAIVDAVTGRGLNYDGYINVHRPYCYR